MPERFLVIDGVRVPRFLYGTAWKEEATQRLTELALEQGFRGIDTANQRRHYHEAAVGQAIAAAVARGLVARADLFLQTKFTFRRGHDQRLPYDATRPSGARLSNRSPVRSRTWAPSRLIAICCTGPRSGRVWLPTTGPPGALWKRSMKAAGRVCSGLAMSRLSSSRPCAGRRACSPALSRTVATRHQAGIAASGHSAPPTAWFTRASRFSPPTA